MARVALILLLTTACGVIEVSDDLDVDAGHRGNGTGMGNGMGNGMGGHRDGGASVPDAGPACTTPDMPMAWPFAKTKTAYLADFYAVPNIETCVACHTELYEPRIWSAPTDLDDPTKLTEALRIWEHAVPKIQEDGSNTPGMLWHHVAGKGAQDPIFEPATLSFLEMFVTRGSNCAWAPVIATEPPLRDPLLCEPPANDLSYCE